MKNGKQPAGFILHETVMAVALAMCLVVGIAQLLAMAGAQRRTVRQQAVAAQEAANLMEDLVSRAWDDTTPQRLGSAGLSQECGRALADAKLQVDVADEDEDTRRISIHIDWRRASGQRGQPVRLVGWKFRAAEAGP